MSPTNLQGSLTLYLANKTEERKENVAVTGTLLLLAVSCVLQDAASCWCVNCAGESWDDLNYRSQDD
jgi:hypothetical protein